MKAISSSCYSSQSMTKKLNTNIFACKEGGITTLQICDNEIIGSKGKRIHYFENHCHICFKIALHFYFVSSFTFLVSLRFSIVNDWMTFSHTYTPQFMQQYHQLCDFSDSPVCKISILTEICFSSMCWMWKN
jgi:hypothetical protein